MLNPQKYPFGVNVIGHATGEYGLGESVRSNLRALKTVGIPFTVANLEVDWHRNLDVTFSEFISEEKPYGINLLNINPEGNLHLVFGTDYLLGRYNIGYWSWELPVLRPEWRSAFDLFDEIWTPSSYSGEAIAAFSPIPVIKIPHTIDLAPPQLNREDLNLPKNKFIFLFMFDLHSTPGRKNPIGLIQAFKQAFTPDNSEVLLLIKMSNGAYHIEEAQRLKTLAEGWPSIQFIEEHLHKHEVQSLLYNCDCYVSLHRAEGFGLTMAEAMFYGKPVIATGYSSNTEFMNVGNSFLVKYDLINVPGDQWYYLEGAVWADPDLDHAAKLMRYVLENYQVAKRIGEKASKDIRALLSPQAIGQQINHRLQLVWQKMNDLSLNGNGQDIISGNEKFKEIASERDLCRSQAEAWKKTALELQQELNKKPQK